MGSLLDDVEHKLGSSQTGFIIQVRLWRHLGIFWTLVYRAGRIGCYTFGVIHEENLQYLSWRPYHARVATVCAGM
jgi:hypothetical protein